MNMLKEFLKTKTAKRALWTMLNTAMAVIVAFIAYATTKEVGWALVVLPVAQALSQFTTKYLNTK